MNHKPALIVTNDEGDWEALYLDGKKVKEGHRLSAVDVLVALGIEIHRFNYPSGTDGQFPEKWNDA